MTRPSAFAALLRGPGRCQLAFTAPFALLAGGLFGHAVAPAAEIPPAVAVPLGAAAFLIFVALQIGLEPWAAEQFGGSDGRWGPLAAYLWDAAMGAVLGFPLASALGASALAGIGAALTAGAVYGWLMAFVVCGEGAELAVRALFEGGGIRRRSEHSQAQALEQRGDWVAALGAWRQAGREDPTDPAPYFALARIHLRLGRSPHAVEVLRDAFARAELSHVEEVRALQWIVDARERQGNRAAAAPDLARYLERNPNGPAAAWARGELAAIKDDLARNLGRAGSSDT